MNLKEFTPAGPDVPAIKEIVSEAAIERSAAIVREAFDTVARDFGLTRENNPGHPAFITFSQLAALKDRGWHLFGLFAGEEQVGFEALGPPENGACGLEKLAVLPRYRHHGYGRALVSFALDWAVLQKAERLELSLINENRVLKNWYIDLGFVETSVKTFAHLPFTVCFMAYDLGGE